MSEEENKKLQVTERLQKREDERLYSLQQRKATKTEDSTYQESADYVLEQFFKIQNTVELALTSYSAETSGNAGKYFENLMVDLQKAQKLVTDSVRILPSYQLEKAQGTINQLKAAVEEHRRAVEPKRKFAFKADKKKASSEPTGGDTADTKATEKPDTQDKVLLSTECGFSNKQDQVLVLSGDDVNKKDVVLSSLSNCRVLICGAASTVHITAVRNCTILCGPTSGSVFVDDCEQSTLVVACHQLRVHHTMSTSVYLHVTSRAIIEDCSELSFAPYNWMYTGLEHDFKKAGLDRQRNNWNCVDDFNWLAAGKPSPNWSVLDRAKRVSSFMDEVANS